MDLKISMLELGIILVITNGNLEGQVMGLVNTVVVAVGKQILVESDWDELARQAI